MKYLIILMVIFVGAWVWRSNRAAATKENQENLERETERQLSKKNMVACAYCGIHLPQIEALAAPNADLRSQSWFCCTEHRQYGPKKAN